MYVPQRLDLGQLIAELEKRPQDERALFDFGNCTPGELMSFRGDYHDLAIGFAIDAVAPTVAELVKQLCSAIGCEFTGYKGGEFKMHEHSTLWVSNRGDNAHTAIFGVCDGEYDTRLLTGFVKIV